MSDKNLYESMTEQIHPSESLLRKTKEKMKGNNRIYASSAPVMKQLIPVMLALVVLVGGSITAGIMLSDNGALSENPSYENPSYENPPHDESVEPDSPDLSMFRGAVTHVYDNAVLVKVSELYSTHLSGQLITVPLVNEDKTEFFVGDTVEVYYSGGIMETYPMQLRKTSNIILLDRDRRINDYYAEEWVALDKVDWNDIIELQLPEFDNIIFKWTSANVTAIDPNGVETVLFYGMPIQNIFIADITGNGYPDFCATVWMGSGVVDSRIIVYDYAEKKEYDLSDRMQYDYALELKNGKLIVTKYTYNTPTLEVIPFMGELAIIDGELVAVGIDRTVDEPVYQNTNDTDDYFDIKSVIDYDYLESVGAFVKIMEVMTYAEFVEQYDDGELTAIPSDRMIWVLGVYYPDGFETKRGLIKPATVIGIYDAETGEYYGYTAHEVIRD
ncbi:MAG: hypothetical protein FWG44_00705 [Oscillospiraceae bacterium]|nr:hypothetical protein [Oscillospiraceae bacterium]